MIALLVFLIIMAYFITGTILNIVKLIKEIKKLNY